MKINKEEFKKTVESIYVELSNEQLDNLSNYSEQLLSNLEKLLELNVKNLEVMHYPFNLSHHSLREDVVVEDKETQYLKNTKNIINKFVVVK